MQNFGKLKTVFNDLLVEGIIKKDKKNKEIFKKYLRTIKESKILTTEFLVFSNIENKIDSDFVSANLYISENLKLFENFKLTDILAENKKLLKIIENEKVDLEVNEDYYFKGLHESLTNLIFTKRTPNSVEKITESIKNISKYITTNQTRVVNESIDFPISSLTKIMVEKYNNKYSEIDESDKIIIKILMGENFEEKEKFYNSTVTECTDLITNLLNEADEELREKLIKTKGKLLVNETLTEENFISKLSKLIGLRDNLKK